MKMLALVFIGLAAITVGAGTASANPLVDTDVTVAANEWGDASFRLTQSATITIQAVPMQDADNGYAVELTSANDTAHPVIQERTNGTYTRSIKLRAGTWTVGVGNSQNRRRDIVVHLRVDANYGVHQL